MWVSDLLEHEVSVWSVQNLFIDVPIRTQSLTTLAWYMKQSKKGLYLSLKCVELRCKKNLRWQTYLLTNQSENNDERK